MVSVFNILIWVLSSLRTHVLISCSTGTTKSKPSPQPSTKVNSSVSKAFPTHHPMTDKAEILKCNHCKRAVAKHSMPKHIESCLNKKQEKQRKKKEAKDARDAAARRERNGTTVGDSEDEDLMGRLEAYGELDAIDERLRGVVEPWVTSTHPNAEVTYALRSVVKGKGISSDP